MIDLCTTKQSGYNVLTTMRTDYDKSDKSLASLTEILNSLEHNIYEITYPVALRWAYLKYSINDFYARKFTDFTTNLMETTAMWFAVEHQRHHKENRHPLYPIYRNLNEIDSAESCVRAEGVQDIPGEKFQWKT